MFVDTHCHLNLTEFDADRGEVVARLESDGLGFVVVVGIDPPTSDSARDISDASPHVFYSAGLHPNSVGAVADDPAVLLAGHFAGNRHPRLVAVGETGIDLFRRPDARAQQMDLFAKHAALARETRLALIVHCRSGAREVIEVLETETPPERVILHCFEGDASLLEFAAARGYHISFAGNLTYPKAAVLREALASAPRELLLAETDAPFLAPQRFRGGRCEPAYVKETVALMAAELGMELSAMKRLLAANARAAFGGAVSEV